jgi:hypothetical protein
VSVGDSINSPGDMTESFDQSSLSPTPPNTWGQTTASAWKVLAAAGATGAETATIVTNPAQGAAHIMGLTSSDVTTLATGTATISSTGSPTAVTTDLAIGSDVTFATGDRLVFKVKAPDDLANCNVQLWYDGATVASRLVTTTIVPEGVVGLLLLAPALPLGIRWWKRRRP